MIIPNYPSSGDLIVTFLDNVRRFRINSVRGVNPRLINVDGELMYIYIKNLSPAQLSNDNPDIWRIQLPKRKEFDEIKNSNHMFLLFGYDYVRKVYTTWNPYWCKQRLNLAESCSMYSRLSLQKRVAATQKIEKLQLQNDVDVICIPASLIASYLKKIKYYYPESSKYVPVGSSIQKRAQAEYKESIVEQKSIAEILYDKFWGCYRASEYRSFLQDKGFQRNNVSNYVTRIEHILDKGYVEKHKDIFLECTSLIEYKRAINRFCWQPDVRYYEDLWHKEISASLKQYLLFVEKKIYGTQNIRIKPTVEDELNSDLSETNEKEKSPLYVLDDFGKLIALDPVIVDRLVPKVRGVDFPDYSAIIKEIKEYYPPQATEKMTPADWFKLFDATKWRKIRGRKAQSNDEETLEPDIKQTSVENETADCIEDILTNEHVTGNKEIIIDFDMLHNVFDKKITSYKYFWFIAIISIAKEKAILSISFDDIVIKMASLAWPIVMGDGIDFGERDMMSKYLKEIQKKTYIISAASSKVVESSLYDYYRILGIDKILAPLLYNVPFRFLSPWIKFSTNEDVVNSSNEETFVGPYSIDSNGIIIKSKWWDYIDSHYYELRSFSLNSFLEYLKQYNSNLKLLRLIKEGWGEYILSTAKIKKEVENVKEEIKVKTQEDDSDSSVKVGDRIKLFPSQQIGSVVELRKDKKGFRRIIVRLNDGGIKEIDDNNYLYQKLFTIGVGSSQNSEKNSRTQGRENLYDSRSINRKVRVGDWIQIKRNGKICKVTKIDKFGSNYDRLILEYKNGQHDWILNNPELYDIVL